MTSNLRDKPEVIGIAAALGLDEFTVVGMLHHFWSWADTNTEDGNAPGVTGAWIDRYVMKPGFAASLESYGWLTTTPQGVRIPDFEVHMAQSAKKRALTARRVSKHRNAPSVTEALPDKSKRKSKRRVEKKREEETTNGNDLSRSAAPKHDRAADVATVVSHYQSLHPRARPGTKEKAKIRARLTEGFTAEDICDGIDGCHATPHNAGDNDRGRQYLSLELIVRDASKLTQFIEGKERAGKLMLGDRLSKTSANMERWLQKDGDNGQAHIPDGHGEPRGDLREGAPGATARGVLADPREA